jgi:hypothetical protein
VSARYRLIPLVCPQYFAFYRCFSGDDASRLG